jgi:hypothetical protein
MARSYASRDVCCMPELLARRCTEAGLLEAHCNRCRDGAIPRTFPSRLVDVEGVALTPTSSRAAFCNWPKPGSARMHDLHHRSS